MKSKNLNFKELHPFSVSVSYHNPYRFSASTEPPSHVHNQCEIYLNLTGDVSFIVEGHTYPISSGSVIITKPFEYHHCIYHDTLEHEHFCLLFSATGNEDVFDIFFNRKKGENNHIFLPADALTSIRKHFDALLSQDEESTIDTYYHFFKILQCIGSNYDAITQTQLDDIPQTLRAALKIIDERYSEPLTMSMLAQEIFVSVNTIERHFKKYLLTSPSEYIRTKRLAAAIKLLNHHTPISTVATQCGFPDTSNFIATFRRYFGTTPYKYMKTVLKKEIK